MDESGVSTMQLSKRISFVLGLLLLLIVPLTAQDDPAEVINNEEGGPISLIGTGDYTFPFFDTFLPEPFVILVDISGSVVERDLDFYPSQRSQVLGTITSETLESPVEYVIDLPFRPTGETRDVDNDSQDESGVMIFSISLASNTWGDPFFEERDYYNTGILNSATFSIESETLGEITGGKLILYAPDEGQGFPAGFGADGLLFTEDDPIVTIPQGYSVVDLDSDPFTFDRSREPQVALIESEAAGLDDFSDLGLVEAFDATLELLSREYAFTDYAGMDWDALADEFRPRIAAAAEADDLDAYRLALLDFSYRIPDPHVYGLLRPQEDWGELLGGLGLYLLELDDGRIIAYGVQPEGPAAAAGIVDGAEIIQVNDQKITDRIASTQPLSFNSIGAPHIMELEKLRWALRFDIGEAVELTYSNPGEDATTQTITADFEVETLFAFPTTPTPNPNALPVEYEIRDDGYMLVRFASFSDDLPLTVALWERMIQTANANQVPGIIVDMRANGGGSGYIADITPAYFFDEELVTGLTAIYSEDIDDFFVAEELESEFILPPEDLRYRGPVAVLVGPDCASACESFAFNMTLNNRAEIIGYFPTVGAGGSVVPIALPGDLELSYSRGRGLDPDGNIHIQNIGVEPTVQVPLTEETLFSEDDALITAAIASLVDRPANTVTPSTDAGSTEPEETQTITIAQFGVTTVIPARYVEFSEGTYGSDDQSEAILLFTLPVADVDTALAGLIEQGLELQGEPTVATYGDRDWQLYATDLDGVTAQLAISQGDGVVYVVLLLAETNIDGLTQTVLVPALENFTVE